MGQNFKYSSLHKKAMGLKEELRIELRRSASPAFVKYNLMARGYSADDIDSALKDMMSDNDSEKNNNNYYLSIKEFLDRVGHGFASPQFVNILFTFTGASLFLIGLINGLKTALVYLLSGFLREYSKIQTIGKTFISTAGILYGFSFLGMGFSIVLKSPGFFAFSLLLGIIGIIAHGDAYSKLYNTILKSERRNAFLKFISYFGILITAIAILLAALLIDWLGFDHALIINPASWNLVNPIMFNFYGYLIAFEITAIMFIISGYIMSKINEKEQPYSNTFYFGSFFKNYFKEASENTHIFVKNNKILLLTIAMIATTIIQVIGNSYYGIFIYENFKNQFLGGFLNVAVIFVIALITSLAGTFLTKRFAKSLGEAPMLVFGTLLIALLPLTFYYNANLYSISLATALSIIGGAIVGVAQGLIAERLMSETEMNTFFTSLGYVSIIPTIIFVGIGAFLAQAYSLQTLFLWLGIILACVIMPLYFVIVLILEGEYRLKMRAK